MSVRKHGVEECAINFCQLRTGTVCKF